MRSFFVSFALLAAFAIPTAVRADNFVLAGGGSTLSFSLPSSPAPTSTDSNGFSVSNVAVTFNGTPGTDEIDFFTAADSGGFSDSYFGDASTDQLFTGSVSDPTFTLGTYTLSDSDGLPYGIVTISKTSEPKSLLLFGTGALGLIGVSRRRPSL